MKDKLYIVYDPNTLRIIKEFSWCGEAIDYADRHKLQHINRTHPSHKELLSTLIK